jgi:hypothetical protein
MKLIAIGSLLWLAHSAPSGWAYDNECCSGMDCYEEPTGAVLETPAGYKIVATGEVVPYEGPGGKALDGGIIARRHSQDQSYHRCSRNGGDPKAPSLCLYVPPGSV